MRRFARSATGGSAGSRVLAGRGVRSTWPLLDWIRAVGASTSGSFLPVSSAAGQLGRLVSGGLALHFRAATVALVRYNRAATATSLLLVGLDPPVSVSCQVTA